jgi:hypothetical protein
LIKLSKEEFEIVNEAVENLIDNFHFKFARKFLVDLKFFNYHVEVVQKSIFETLSNSFKQTRLHTVIIVLLFKLRKPMFILSELLTNADIEVVVILQYPHNEERNH